jgi:hypothetical protein
LVQKEELELPPSKRLLQSFCIEQFSSIVYRPHVRTESPSSKMLLLLRAFATNAIRANAEGDGISMLKAYLLDTS